MSDYCCAAGEIVARTNAAIEAMAGDLGPEGTKTGVIPSERALQPLVVHLGLDAHAVGHLIEDISRGFWTAVLNDQTLTTEMVNGFIGQCLLAGHFAGQVES